MHLSHYLKIWPDPEFPASALVYSTRKASACTIPLAVLDQLRRGQVPPAAAEPLTELGILVADPAAERAATLAYVDEINRLDPNVTAAVILGMGCNFACPYCYEGSLKGAGAMDAATGAALVRYLLDRLAPGKDTLRLDFYGGEPLLYLPRLEQVVGDLVPRAERRGVRCQFSLVTNGSLLTPQVAARLLELGVRTAKVTLDGPPAEHDQTRPFADGRGSFATICANLAALPQEFKFSLGGNFTAANWRSFPALFDHLHAAGLGPERVARMAFCPVSQCGDGAANPEFTGGCASVAEPWLAEATLALRAETLRRGYRVPKMSPSPCMVDLDAAFTVNWDGTLTQCPALIGRPEYVTGDLQRGSTDYRDTLRVGRWKDQPECQTCPDLPLCFGGCRFMHLERQGSLAGVDCQKPFLDATLEPTIRQDLQHKLSA